MTSTKHHSASSLRGRAIDCHAHIGVSLKAYACLEYPYAQTIEGHYYRQNATGIDAAVVFPASSGLFFDPQAMARGEMRPAMQPLSPSPYALENRMLMLEVFSYNPAISDRFIPFAAVDPARSVSEQLDALTELENEFPIYGIKVSGVECQSPVTALLDEGRGLVEFAAERNIPFLLHTTADPDEDYSRADLAFEVTEAFADVRFCLAHCIGFSRSHLERADSLPNVWVDTSALKIQVQCARENNRLAAPPANRFPADYTDHVSVMKSLMHAYPNTILWGTDSPWHTFICRRKQAEGSFLELRLSGSYEDEVAALDALPGDLRRRACNENTMRFLFGEP